MSDQAPEGRRRTTAAVAARDGRPRGCTPSPSGSRSSRARCTPFEVLTEEGLETDRAQRRHDPGAGRDRVPRGAGRARAVQGSRGRCGRRARAVPARALPAAGAGDRAPGVHAVRAQPCEQRADRRHRHRARARVRLAVRARPGRRPSVRHDRGLPELREARVHLAVPAPLGRHGVRAGRPAGEQAALRHGVRAHAVLRQAVHGLGHASAARRRTRSTWRASCSAPTTWTTTASC